PIAVIASVAVSVFQEVVFFDFHNTDAVDVSLLVATLLVFVVRRGRLGRVDEAATSSWAATEEVRPIPAELAGLPVVKTGVRRLLIFLGVLVIGFPFVMSTSQV